MVTAADVLAQTAAAAERRQLRGGRSLYLPSAFVAFWQVSFDHRRVPLGKVIELAPAAEADGAAACLSPNSTY